MRALWLEDRKLRLRDDLPIPLRDGEVVVRVLLGGICNTDIEMTRGYYPFTGVPGHEFVGVVDGKRVVGEINASCGSCEACRAGRRTHCEKRSVLGIRNRDGAFADYLTLPAENLHVVPEEISDEEAVFVEPLAAALQIQEQVRITPDDRVLVVGHGKLGQLIAQTLALTGCKVTVVGRNNAAEVGGGTQTFDVAIECTGNPEGFAIARKALRPRGTLVMKSTYAGNLNVNASSLVVDEITLVGSRCGPFAPALALLAEHKVDVRPLIHATYSLDDSVQAFEYAQRRGTMKVLIRVS
ncbi:MAG TPA: alcohol dehydrogenase catalytic domain-containing protein [Thermoanaerobaculia bacterium]